MKFLNITNNTIYLEDIDKYISFTEHSQEIDSNQIKKSKFFQFLVSVGKIKIVEINDIRIEKNLQRKQNDFFNQLEITSFISIAHSRIVASIIMIYIGA